MNRRNDFTASAAKQLSREYNLNQIRRNPWLITPEGKLRFDLVEFPGENAPFYEILRGEGMLNPNGRCIMIDKDAGVYERLHKKYGDESDTHLLLRGTLSTHLPLARLGRVTMVNFDSLHIASSCAFETALREVWKFVEDRADKYGAGLLIINVDYRGRYQSASEDDFVDVLHSLGHEVDRAALDGVKYRNTEKNSNRINYAVHFGAFRPIGR